MINAEKRVDLSENVLHSDPFIDILSIRSDCDKHAGGESLCKTRHSDIDFPGILLKTPMSSLLQQHSQPASGPGAAATAWSLWFPAFLGPLLLKDAGECLLFFCFCWPLL